MAVLLGVIAGILTTVAGMGGGQILLIGLAVLWDPVTALTVTAPALMVGNAHRLWMFRAHFDRQRGARYVAGTFPGALIGGGVALAIPPEALTWIMVAMVGVAALRLVPAFRITAPASLLTPGGLAVGFVSATGGGAGLIGGPLLLGSGLSGRHYIACGAAGSLAAHLGRLMMYGAGGRVDPAILWWGVALAAAITAGNVAGRRLRQHVPDHWTPRIEVGTVVGCAALALIA